jgi:hypothetical protein
LEWFRRHLYSLLELIGRGADVNLLGREWDSPPGAAVAAARKGDEKVLHALLDRGADVNGKGGSTPWLPYKLWSGVIALPFLISC